VATIEYNAEAWKKLLQPRHIVHFVGGPPEFWHEPYASNYFKVVRTQQIPYDRAYLIAPNATEEFYLDDHNAALGDLALYPDNSNSLYEILLGMKSSSGGVLCYPRAPENEWFESLEQGGYLPDTANPTLRYLSPFTEEITPCDRPTVRFYTVKDDEGVGILLYNDTDVTQKVVLCWLVNRCLIDKVDPSKLSPEDIRRARELNHFKLMTRGAWGPTQP